MLMQYRNSDCQSMKQLFYNPLNFDDLSVEHRKTHYQSIQIELIMPGTDYKRGQRKRMLKTS